VPDHVPKLHIFDCRHKLLNLSSNSIQNPPTESVIFDLYALDSASEYQRIWINCRRILLTDRHSLNQISIVVAWDLWFRLSSSLLAIAWQPFYGRCQQQSEPALQLREHLPAKTPSNTDATGNWVDSSPHSASGRPVDLATHSVHSTSCPMHRETFQSLLVTLAQIFKIHQAQK